MAWPFRIGPTGAVDYVEDPYVAAIQHLEQLILTNLGERVMRPTYGSVTQSFLFENNNEVVVAELAIRLQSDIELWAPEIRVQSVTPELLPAEGIMQITVAFSVPPRDTVFTTVVGVGGAISEGFRT